MSRPQSPSARVRVSRLTSRRTAVRTGALAAFSLTTAMPESTTAEQSASPLMANATVTVPCVPCEGLSNDGSCCLPGFTGGGVISLDSGEAQIVVFAMRINDDSAENGTGLVRWIETAYPDGPMTLESFGPITYQPVDGVAEAREIRGTMHLNAMGNHVFLLRVADFGPARMGEDSAALSVTNEDGIGRLYEAEGTLIGGDFQLLNAAAPLPTG